MAATSVYDPVVRQAAAISTVPTAWIKAVIGAETSFQSPAPLTWEPLVNDYSYGPMQILLATADGLGFTGSTSDLADPIQNIPIGAEYLAQLRDRWGDDFRRVYSAYVSGDPDAWLTSAQVAADVEHAMTWLSQFGGTVQSLIVPGSRTIIASPPIAVSTAGAGIAIVILMFLFALQRK